MAASNTDRDTARIIVALDFPDARTALACADRLDPGLCKLKVGFELFLAAGPPLVETLVSRGFDVFLDLKFHDIPNTVAATCRVAAGLRVWMLNVHAGGGRAMLEAAREALAACEHRPRLIAVTVLTSLGDNDLTQLGMPYSATELAARFARMAHNAGLDGIVCSARDVPAIKPDVSAGFLFVTPGIRFDTDGVDDQKRVLTPAAAIASGATYLVMGRSITSAQNILSTLESANCEVRQVLAGRDC